MKLFIVGMPGSGKSKLGEELASMLKFPFYDLDEGIEHEVGMTIPEIFRHKGEKYFRMMESKLLRRFPDLTGHFVLSTGGGAPCFFDNMGFMNDEGKTVFLDVPLEELVERLINAGLRDRPLLKDKSPDVLHDYLETQLAQRIHFYRNAMLTVSGKDIIAEDLYEEIRRMGW
jgi:shikimate kinase